MPDGELVPIFLPVPPFVFLEPRELVERIHKVGEEITTEAWEEWRKAWFNILMSVHSAATDHDPETFEDAMHNASNYLALSSLLGTVTSLISIGKIVAMFRAAFR